MNSKTKFYILFFGSIIFIFWLFSDLLGTGYYTTPEAALANQNGEDSVKTILLNIQKEDDAIIIYISRSNTLVSVSFKNEVVNSVLGFKISRIGRTPDVHNIDASNVVPFNIFRSSGEIYVLYGITKSSQIANVKINGQIPKLVPYEVDGEEYIFWYTLCTYDAYHKDVEVTYE